MAASVRDALRDPDSWLCAAACLSIAFGCAQLLAFSFGRDQSIYAVVGQGILHGQVPYRDLWDFKPPGIFFVYALAQALFGNTMLAPRLLELGGLCVLLACFLKLSHVFFGLRRVGLVGAALAVIIYTQLDFWHTGQPESFAAFLTFVGLVFTVDQDAPSRRWIGWSVVGAAFGCAFLLKPHIGAAGLACAVYQARHEMERSGKRAAALKPLLVMSLAGVLPVALCAWWFHQRGAWASLKWTLFEFAPGYTRLGWPGHNAAELYYSAIEEVLFRFSVPAGVGFLAAALPAIHSREREGIFLALGVLAVQLAGVAIQSKFFQYHFSPSLLLISFIAGLGVYKLWRRCVASGPGGMLAFSSVLVVAMTMRLAVHDLPGDFWHRSAVRYQYLLGIGEYRARERMDSELYYVADYNLDADRRAALQIHQRTNRNDTIFVWGFEPAIYFLSDRKPASRFIYNVAQRATWERTRARLDLIRDLRAYRPAVIVVQQNDFMPSVTGDELDSKRALPGFPELQGLMDDHYALVDSIEDFQLFEHR
ncbi:MAG TPA: glycosyltransferase family 39 protein [Polyangiaceae bacterium]